MSGDESFDLDSGLIAGVGSVPAPTVVLVSVVGTALRRIVCINGGMVAVDAADVIEATFLSEERGGKSRVGFTIHNGAARSVPASRAEFDALVAAMEGR